MPTCDCKPLPATNSLQLPAVAGRSMSPGSSHAVPAGAHVNVLTIPRATGLMDRLLEGGKRICRTFMIPSTPRQQTVCTPHLPDRVPSDHVPNQSVPRWNPQNQLVIPGRRILVKQPVVQYEPWTPRQIGQPPFPQIRKTPQVVQLPPAYILKQTPIQQPVPCHNQTPLNVLLPQNQPPLGGFA